MKKRQSIQFHTNAFDMIRYWAAISVMLLHYTGYVRMLSAQTSQVLIGIRKIAEFFPGVIILFAMSGYLVSASMERSADKKAYFRKRVFRMYPELWLCTLVNLIVVVVLVYPQLDFGIVVWCLTQVFGIANTPDCLKTFATGSVNGALWTIFTEIQLYIVLAFVFAWLKKRSHVQWWFLIGLAAIVNVGCGFGSDLLGGSVAKIIERIFVPYLVWFLIGSYCFVKRDEILYPLKRSAPYLLVFYIILRWCGAVKAGYYTDILTSILLPLLVIGTAYWLPAIRIKFDCTYGIFLYHWIVLNVLIHFDLLNRIPWVASFLIFFVSTFAIAALSAVSIRVILRTLKR